MGSRHRFPAESDAQSCDLVSFQDGGERGSIIYFESGAAFDAMEVARAGCYTRATPSHALYSGAVQLRKQMRRLGCQVTVNSCSCLTSL